MKIKLILFVAAIATLSACSNNPKTETIATEQVVEGLSSEEKKQLVEQGKAIAQNTFKVLGGNLKNAMAKGGVENAINYCNANASNLIDSLSVYHNATIRRTSNKLRNEANSPTEKEQTILDSYQNGGEMKPIVQLLENGNTAFYAPITMKALCISCHGTVGETISNEDYSFISQHYPNDQATGYQEGDFRGIWSIEIKK